MKVWEEIERWEVDFDECVYIGYLNIILDAKVNTAGSLGVVGLCFHIYLSISSAQRSYHQHSHLLYLLRHEEL